MAAAEKGKKKRAPLSSFTILLIILVVLAIVTVIMSASGVEGVQGATLSQVLTAPVFGFQDAIGVCLFVMILGGFLGIVTETGALDAGIAALVHKLKGNELVLIPILMAIFSIGGTTYGMCEETVPFYLLLAATMVAAIGPATAVTCEEHGLDVAVISDAPGQIELADSLAYGARRRAKALVEAGKPVKRPSQRRRRCTNKS